MDIIERFKKARNITNLSQAKFAETIATTQGKIKDIEIGKGRVTPEIAKKIEDIYNINLRWLLFGEGPMFTGNTNKLRPMPADAKKQLENWGQRLEVLQVENDLFLAQFAKVLKISENRAMDLLTKSKKPTIDEIIKIKENFDVSIDDLLFGELKTNPMPAESQDKRISELEDIVKKLSEKLL